MKGWGKLNSTNEVEVALLDGGSTTLRAKNIIIATGSEVAPLPGIEIDEERCGPRCHPLQLPDNQLSHSCNQAGI